MTIHASWLREAALASAVACASLVNPTATIAAVMLAGRPVPQQQVRPNNLAIAPWRAVRSGPHMFFGTIVAIRGPQLSIRLRNGQVRKVDAAVAIAHGDYSAPLFIGKMVCVDGDLRGATFTAAHVFRLESLTDLGADR